MRPTTADREQAIKEYRSLRASYVKALEEETAAYIAEHGRPPVAYVSPWYSCDLQRAIDDCDKAIIWLMRANQ